MWLKRGQLISLLVGLIGSVLIFSSISYADALPPGVLIGDSDGIHVDESGAYYIQQEDLVPGDAFSKKIQLMNTEKGDRPYVLEMAMAPKEKEGAIDFYEAITVTMTLDGKEIYRGNLVGKGMPDLQTARLPLGTYAYGDFAELEVSFKVADDLPDEVWKTESYAIIRWDFYATKKKKPADPKKIPPPVKKGLLPQTGEEWRSLIYKVITGIFIICVVLLFVKKRKQRHA